MDTLIRTQTGYVTRSDDLSFFFSKTNFHKNTMYAQSLTSIFEKSSENRVNLRKEQLWFIITWYTKLVFKNPEFYVKDRLIARLVLFDMISLYKMWRHIKGYPANGQRTWSNGKSCSKNSSVLKSFRLEQMQTAYGLKKRTNYQTLIQAEYNNKLWMKTWASEWLQARKYSLKQKHAKTKAINVDINSLALGITSGYKRRGKAAKFNKAKKSLKIVTIGLPIYFTRYIFGNGSSKKFPHKVGIQQQERKFKSKKLKKKVVNKKK